MRVLQVIASMDPAAGGTSQGIRNSIPELEKLGYQNEVVCLDSPDAAFIKKDLFKLHAIGPSKGPWQYSPNLLPWLSANLVNFDVVIINGLWLYHGYAVMKQIGSEKRKGNNKTRVYIMPHGMLDPYFQKAGSRKLKAIRNWVYWKAIEGKIINTADGILFTCESEKVLARQTFTPYKPKRELNVGYGIQTPPPFDSTFLTAFYSKCKGAENQRYLLFLSRIHEKKGVDLLLNAYKAVLKTKTGNQEKNQIPKLVIAGPDIESAYGKEILKIVADDPSLERQVFFPGMLSGDAKWGAFYGCEAFVLPSHQENFGIAVVEALACSKPVLISDKVNIWNEISAENAGLVAEDTIEGTQKLLTDFFALSTEEKSTMGLNAFNCFKNKFTIEAAALNFSEAINN
ncbi:MAG: glycosyltransferase [Bacteroidota bacterium]